MKKVFFSILLILVFYFVPTKASLFYDLHHEEATLLFNNQHSNSPFVNPNFLNSGIKSKHNIPDLPAFLPAEKNSFFFDLRKPFFLQNFFYCELFGFEDSTILVTPPKKENPPRCSITVSLDNAYSNTSISCFGDSTGVIDIKVKETGTGGGPQDPLYFEWFGPFIDSSATLTQSNLPAGNYTVVVSDTTKGCTDTLNVTILQPAAPLTIGIDGINNISCNGGNNGSISITPSGGTPGYSYLWTGNGAITNSQNQNNLSAGNYSVQVTDANGCSVSIDTSLSQPTSSLDISVVSIGSVSCNGGNDGNVNVSVTGGVEPHVYAWTQTGSTFTSNNPNLTGLSAGNYVLTVTDSNLCEKSITVTISEPDPIDITISAQSNVSCFGGSDGSISVIVNGGSGIYSYVWTGSNFNASTQNISGLLPGHYILTVTDSKGCTSVIEAGLLKDTGLNEKGLIGGPS